MIISTIAKVASDHDAPLLPRILCAYYLVSLSSQLMKHANVVFRDEFHFSKRIVFPYSPLRRIPVKLLLYACEREPSLVNTLYIGVGIKLQRFFFSVQSQFLQRIRMERKELICSLNSELAFIYMFH